MEMKIDIGEQTAKKNKIRELVLGCRNCPLGGQGHNVPGWGGVYNPKFVIVGEAPGMTEVRQGKPLVGRSGKMLWSELAKHKIYRSDTFTINSVSCLPTHWSEGELKGRTPTHREQAACTGIFRSQLSLVSHCRFILALGGVALRRFKPGVKIGDWVGKPIVWKNHIVIPTYHPAGVMRNADEFSEPFEQAIQLLVNMVRLGDKFGDIMPVFCNRCGSTEIYASTDDKNWCGDCWLEEYQLPLEGMKRAKPTKLTVSKTGKVLRGRVKK